MKDLNIQAGGGSGITEKFNLKALNFCFLHTGFTVWFFSWCSINVHRF